MPISILTPGMGLDWGWVIAFPHSGEVEYDMPLLNHFSAVFPWWYSDDDLDQEPIPLGNRLWCFILFPLRHAILMWWFIVILGEEGMGYSPFIRELADSHVAHVLAMAPGSACHEQNILAALIQWYMTTHTHIHLVPVLYIRILLKTILSKSIGNSFHTFTMVIHYVIHFRDHHHCLRGHDSYCL